MTPERWEQLQTLFHRAVQCAGEERTRVLESADPELRSELEAMLSCDERATDCLRDLLNSEIETPPTLDLPQAKSGARIGSYHLLELIGEGGMGEVWLAEQKQPVRRRVALKLIKTGMNTREVMARFESERQALALMDHPAIAKVFDVGSTPEGRPYFAMEYVPGVAITDYCDKHKLTTQQRLELFILVCEGVQHAHQKAIIHRDLKPSNILVADVDGKPMPRIIDFGVAKAIGQRLTPETMFTEHGAMIGTIGYMSPEQADSSREDIDTRSDVYSLGVVLYELLVGVLPFDFRKAALDEALRHLREDDAPKPSTKLRPRGKESTATAKNRGTDVPTLVRQVRGDPDVIALKALEKDRARRYATPLDLANDIGRYLRHEPVAAHPPSVAYRAHKYVRRHRMGVGATAAVILILMVAGAVSVRQSMRANRQTAVAQALNDFLLNDLLARASAAAQAGPRSKPEPHLEVRTVLDRAAARTGGKFDRQPEVEAAIRDTIGQSYMGLGLYPEARTQLERALDLDRRVFGARDPKTLRAMSRIGDIESLQGKYSEAEELLKNNLNIQRHVLAPDDPDTLASANSLATAYEREGKYPEAEPLFRQTLDIRRRVLGLEHRDTLASMNDLAVTYAEQAKYPQAEALFRQVLKIDRRVLGPEHPDTLRAMDNLADTYEAEGKYTEAADPYRQVTEIKRRVLGPEHPETLRSMGNLAVAYEAAGKYSQAEKLQRQILEVSRRLLGGEHPETLRSMGNLADTYNDEGKYVQAETLFRQTLPTERRVFGPEHPNTLETLSEFAWLWQRQGKYASVETYGAQVLAGRRRVYGSDNPDTMSSAADLALAYISDGKFVQSEPLAREALEFNRKNQPDNWQRFRAESLLGASLAGQKKYAEAEPLLVGGYRGMVARKDRIDVPDRYHLERAHEWIVELYRAWGRPAQAGEWKNK